MNRYASAQSFPMRQEAPRNQRPRVDLRSLAIAWLLGAMLGSCPLALGADREALPMTGKTGLYQRVLTRPGALLNETPGKSGASGEVLPPLSILHVYARQRIGDQDWIEVGAAVRNGVQGWLPATAAIDWRQTLTVAFARTENREPALFFRDQASLVSLLESEQLTPETNRLRAAIQAGQIPDGFPAIAREPDTYVDPNRQFYLLPILGFEEVYLESGHSATLLNIAAVTLQAGEQDLLASEPTGTGGEIPVDGAVSVSADYRAAVVFVIDTTTSMGPYINRTRDAVRRIYDQLKGSPMGDALTFGLVAYRDNVDVAPGLGYVTQVVATLKDGRDPSAFLSRIAQVEESNVSSKGFNEDAFAGIHDAIERIDWSGYAGRFIVLITDAGARDATDPLARTQLGAERLRLLAQEKDQVAGGGKIAIATLHLLTPEGRQTHAGAAAQYRALSRWGDAGDLYFPVEGGSVDAFGAQVDTLADVLVQQIQGIRSGQVIQVPKVSDANEVERRTALVGRAMQLAYLGRERGSRAPRLIDAWVADRDLLDPSQKTLEVRVLITKNQLSDLQETLEAIFRAGEGTFMSPKDFFGQLRGAAAALARNPNQVSQVQVGRLADVGLVGEWLDDLPYTSQVMNLTEARWLSRSFAEQQEVLDAIEEKIRLYRRIHDETDRWITLAPTVPKGESVTTVPLDVLP
ncbi:vWA domain-containing protein [Thiocystis violascens]|uniref:von Willebrand factor type A-like protein n=1 Tax=Thiocystis violascens (strain ATCC 17096 / DSM 198 / 6111) TaxID=765911 RepID=I3YE75_THIV6|nr:vWA domain-containing protein [Thiocystis violascens]AFL75293.1 von Willebrand factor type A-like protein [Thiocystis violascens DSM 198]